METRAEFNPRDAIMPHTVDVFDTSWIHEVGAGETVKPAPSSLSAEKVPVNGAKSHDVFPQGLVDASRDGDEEALPSAASNDFPERVAAMFDGNKAFIVRHGEPVKEISLAGPTAFQ